ncbi:hypothetical protein BS17DRAFT_368877 [Gyrodon lividus]|nr:hypothetical protein BS17DRAFT_368877 [Gyrodon lividus]
MALESFVVDCGHELGAPTSRGMFAEYDGGSLLLVLLLFQVVERNDEAPFSTGLFTPQHLSSPLISFCSTPHWNLMQTAPFYSDKCRELIPY